MTTELLARAQRQTREEQARRYPRVSKDAGKLAAAVGVLLEATTWGPEITLELVCAEVPRRPQGRGGPGPVRVGAGGVHPRAIAPGGARSRAASMCITPAVRV